MSDKIYDESDIPDLLQEIGDKYERITELQSSFLTITTADRMNVILECEKLISDIETCEGIISMIGMDIDYIIQHGGTKNTGV